MNIRWNLLGATALLGAAALIIMDQHPPEEPVPAPQPGGTRGKSIPDRSAASILSSRFHRGNLVPLRDSEESPPVNPSAAAEAPENLANGTVGVRLALNVRLPAASLAKEMITSVSPEVAVANQQIENEFYRELLERALTPKPGLAVENNTGAETAEIAVDENGEKTVIVHPGAEAEEALHRSDEAFRSMFGNDAYNRRKMEGVAELGISEEQ